MKIQPILPTLVLVIIFFVIFGATAAVIIKNKFKTKDKILTLLRLSIIYLLAFTIGLRPVTVETKYEYSTKNLDVLFVVDTTLSMWAEDYNGKKPRMRGAVKDMQYICEELAGSNFGLVTFDNQPRVISPFTQDMQYVEMQLDFLEQPDSRYANGSDFSTPYKDLEALVLSSYRKEERKTIVFFISDGEVNSLYERKSFEDLAQYIDGGAVIGYGTEKGGKMDDGTGYIYDPSTGKDAISHIDEENLQAMADEMGLQYLNCNESNAGLKSIVTSVLEASADVMEEADGAEIYKDTYFIFAIPLALMLILELAIVLKRGRL